jgi:hypothetical protein
MVDVRFGFVRDWTELDARGEETFEGVQLKYIGVGPT